MPIYALDDRMPKFVDPSSNWIAPGAVIIGDVTIGRNVSIWFGVVLRGDRESIVIGDDSNIQENAVMHTDPGYPLTVGRGCTIGHRAMIHGCTIGDETLIGMSSTVLNGARIPSHCLVGAASLITEGKEFSESSLIVGAPARAVRPLSSDDIARIRRTGADYVKNGRRFRDGLVPVEPQNIG